jgi:acid phosphatase (class A)
MTAVPTAPRALRACLACLLFALAACAGPGAASRPSAVAADGRTRPYLADGAGIDSLAFLPPPPAPDSAAFAHDRAVAAASLALRDTPRWELAAEDANLDFPRVAGTFACAVGTAIDEESTPALYRLLRRANEDAARATRAAKDHYRRARPFTADDAPICTPLEGPSLRANGSYPSGHATRGWLWGLIVAAADPEHAPAALARGRAYGDSRVVCHVHWRSDVLAGRELAAATFALLAANPEFRADLEAARTELPLARARGRAPARDCAAEGAALAAWPPLTP